MTMLNLTTYQKAGYGFIFVETMEIKRAMRSIEVDEPFRLKKWSPIRGLIHDYNKFDKDVDIDSLKILDYSVGRQEDDTFDSAPLNTAIILESYDEYLDDFTTIQTLLDYYEILKANATMLVFVGTDSTAIPSKLKEFIPVIQFKMPNETDIRSILKEIAETSIETLGEKFISKFKVTSEIIEACKGLTWEEIENAAAKSAVETKSFDHKHIMDRKKTVIKQTGFMSFSEPEPIENLGGLKKFKDYWELRAEPFTNDDSIKPKVKAIMVAGFPGTGKSLGAKVLASILGWPLITVDLGSTKEGIVGESEKKIRYATYTIDSVGRAVILIDEIEKYVGGNTDGATTTSGVDEGILGHLLTWMQERDSEGILYGTANNLSALPPEFKRAGGRWDTIFFVNLPNHKEVKEIIEIHNRKYNADVPIDGLFCKRLEKEGWSGAEIEQLAKDSHYESIDECIENIPILSKHEKAKFDKTREMAKMYRWANTKEKAKLNIKPRKLNLN